MQKLVLFGKNGYIGGKIGVMGKTVVLEQSGLYLARIGFIWPNRLYLAKRVFFDQNLFYLVAIVGVSKSF